MPAATHSSLPAPSVGQDRGRVRLPRTERRAQLLEAAQQVFVEFGYHAAAMDDIADRAGVSKPVLYQHFPGKLDLYLALLDQHAAHLLEEVRRALASTSDNKLRVVATIEAYFDFVARDGAAFRLVFESDLTNEAAVRERVDAVAQDCAEAISEVISEDTDLPEAEAHLLAMALSGMAQVSARFWLAQGASIPRSEAARLVAALSWRGLGGFPKTAREARAALGVPTEQPGRAGLPSPAHGRRRSPS